MTGQQLKNSILQMAVQGKLVPQDHNDEPASVLLERIRKEKEQLIKEGKIKKEKNPSVIFRGADNLPYEKVRNETHCLSELAPFDIPETWEWCRVGDLFYNASGLSYKKELLAKKSDSMVRVLRGGNIGDETYFFKKDDVFISSEYVKSELLLKKNYMITPAVSSIEHIGKIALLEQDYTDVVVGGFVLMLMPYFSDDIISQYLLYAFAAKYHRDNCRNITHKSGQAFYNLSREKLMNLPVPLPPYNEMLRIIEKLKTVLPIAAEYSSMEQDVYKLNTTFPDLLKKSILQEAVQGKLVSQDPNDEPASVLLERIRAEKQRLIKEGKIKKDKHESVIFRRDNSHYEKLDGIERCIDDEIPFEIPESWEWERWGNISESIQYGYNAPAKDNGRIKMVRISDIQNNAIFWDTVPFCEIEESDIRTYLLQANDILFARTGGTVGKSYLVQEIPEEAIYAGYLIRTRYSQRLCPQYLKYFMESELYWSQLRNGTIATAQPNCNGKTLGKMLLPIPPLPEQYRIVEKINDLFSQCNSI